MKTFNFKLQKLTAHILLEKSTRMGALMFIKEELREARRGNK